MPWAVTAAAPGDVGRVSRRVAIGLLGAAVLVPAALTTAKTQFMYAFPKLGALSIVGMLAFAWLAERAWSGRRVEPGMASRQSHAATLFRMAAVVFGSALVIRMAIQGFSSLSVWGETGRHIGGLMYLMLIVIVMVLSDREFPVTAKNIHNVFLFAGVFPAAYALVQIAGKDPLNFDVKAPFSTLGNMDQMSAWSAMMALAAIIAAVQSDRQRVQRVLASVLAAVSVFVVIILYRSPWRTDQGGILLALGVLVIIIRSGGIEAIRRRHWVTMGLLGLTIGAFTVAIVAVSQTRGLIHRVWMWRTALRIFVDHPLLGVGLSRYGALFEQNRYDGEILRFGSKVFSDDPHSVPLQMLAAGGLLVAIPWCLVVASSLSAGVHAVLDRRAQSLDSLDALTLMTFVYWLQAGFAPESAGLALWGWIASAVVVRECTGGPRWIRRVAAGAVAIREGIRHRVLAVFPSSAGRARSVMVIAIAAIVVSGVMVWHQAHVERMIIGVFAGATATSSKLKLGHEIQGRRDTAEYIVRQRAGDNALALTMMKMLTDKDDPDGARLVGLYTIAHERDNPGAKMQLALLLVRNDQPKPALALAIELTREIPNVATYWMLRGFAAASADDSTEARQSIINAIEIARRLNDTSSAFESNRELIRSQFPYLRDVLRDVLPPR